MNLTAFFEHWGIAENPFRGEEARQDPVFLRLEDGYRRRHIGHGARVGEGDAGAGGAGAAGDDWLASASAMHSDFEKVVGDFDHPATAVVFGEKGAGKTAIRLQLAERLREHNASRESGRCYFVAYDDLNPVLDAFVERMGGRREGRRRVEMLECLGKLRLGDHIDGMLSCAVPGLVDAILEEGDFEHPDLGEKPWKHARQLEPGLRQDLLLLQAVYDRDTGGAAGRGGPEERTKRLRRALRLHRDHSEVAWDLAAGAGWLLPVGVFVWQVVTGRDVSQGFWLYLLVALVALWLGVIAKHWVWDWLVIRQLGAKLRRQIRVTLRPEGSFARSIAQLPSEMRRASVLPVSETDQVRYEMLDRFRRVLKGFGYSGALVVIDRVDEPTVIAGDPDRMRAVIWPLLHNKFLAQPWFGVKMLLPVELRHALFRETASFFQEARLDKQNLIERLAWSGAMLYDLCNARLRACTLPPEKGGPAQPITLRDLFAEDVSRQDLVDALDQMRQPRDAFKLVYQCLTEHCSNVTAEEAQWKIPRLVLESIRKMQAERVRQLYGGVRPA